MPTIPRQQLVLCFCRQCGSTGGSFIPEADLAAHQCCVSESALRGHGQQSASPRTTRVNTGPERQSLVAATVTGLRAERSVVTARAERLLSSIKRDAQVLLNKALTEEIDLQEVKSSLDLLNRAFSDIRCDIPALESLKDEVNLILGTLDDTLSQLLDRNDILKTENAAVIHNSSEFSLNFYNVKC